MNKHKEYEHKRPHLCHDLSPPPIPDTNTQCGHGGVDGYGGSVAVKKQHRLPVDGSVPGWTRGAGDDQVRLTEPLWVILM